MSKPPPKILRCAIYTRVSTDAGLEQEFNSLDAQREASEAYIKSQAHEGWKLIRTGYDDGGFSGGTLERPALKMLLEAVKSKLVDVIVVYKVDRLTRSLADFAKLVELFDANDVSFVSVTQSFSTTTSMGRLTLNVLLSFAQFEREVTGERIRDKIAASKKKGLWMGGTVPLGYMVQDRKLVVAPAEAETVRMIFERYLALGSMLALQIEMNANGVTTRPRVLSTGRKIGGVPFTRGPLAHLLKNRTYLGYINHGDQSYQGEHKPIIDPDVFEAVQSRLAENLKGHAAIRARSNALLLGRLFDDADNTMTPTYARKGGVRYRYYVSRALIEGRRDKGGTVLRAPADSVEIKVAEALQPFGSPADEDDSRAVIQKFVRRVVVGPAQLSIELTEEGTAQSGQQALQIAWSPPPPKPRREIIASSGKPGDSRPIRSDTRATLLSAIATGRQWLQELISGKVADTDAIAHREGRSKRSVHMAMSLAFVAPDIVEAAVEGKLPRGVGATRLVDLPTSWSLQRKRLGLSPRP